MIVTAGNLQEGNQGFIQDFAWGQKTTSMHLFFCLVTPYWRTLKKKKKKNTGSGGGGGGGGGGGSFRVPLPLYETLRTHKNNSPS